jgi:hypothetical protein
MKERMKDGFRRSRIHSVLRDPAPGHHFGSGLPNIDVYIYIGGAIQRYLTDVHRSTSSFQKSEASKPKREKRESRQGLRTPAVISALLHFLKPLANTHRNQRWSRYDLCEELFHPESGHEI